MKAVWTYWNKEEKPIISFNNEDEAALSIELSLRLASKQFPDTELVTNTKGKELLIDKHKLPFNSVSVILDDLNNILDCNHWAFAKLEACNSQKEPFIHIDNDLFLDSFIPNEILESIMFFEKTERSGKYDSLLSEFKYKSKIPKTVVCGIIGCNDVSIITEWYNKACEFLISTDWTSISPMTKNYSNQLFEQYFISELLNNKEIAIKTIFDKMLYRHFYSTLKQDQKIIESIHKQLLNLK